MAGRLLATGLITIAVLALGIWWPWGEWPGKVWMIVLVLLLLGWVGQYLVYVVRHYGHRYRLTPQTFFHESGILVRSSSPIEIIAIADISFQQTILDRLLGVGTIRIVSADRSDPELKLRGIRDVEKVFTTIDQVRRAERRRRALRIDNV
jgi:membrane protein YdbS with pleckstrin-like domain